MPRPSSAVPADSGPTVSRFLASRDPDAFDQLYSDHAPRLHRRFKAKWGLSDHATQDAMQETFLRGALNMHQIADVDKFGAWLTTIADRQAMAVRRKDSESARPELLAGAAADIEQQARSTPAADHAAAVVDTLVVRRAIDALPARLQEVLDLHLESLTACEIGRVLGCSSSLAQRLLDAARDRLVPQLAAFQPPRPPEPEAVHHPMRYQQAIDRLSPRRREVLERHVYRGMKPVKIAADLGISPGCARVHLHLAYKELANQLGIADYRTVISLLKQPPRQLK